MTTLALLAEGIAIEVAGETVYVGEISIDQICDLAAILEPALETLTPAKEAKVRDAAKSAKSGDTDGAVRGFVSVLTPEALSGVCGVLIDRPAEWCRKNVKLTGLIQIAKGTWDANDPSVIAGLFTPAAPAVSSAPSPEPLRASSAS